MSKIVEVLQVGLINYGPSLKLQTLIRDLVKEKKLNNALLIVEHNPVYTVGIRDNLYNKEEENRLISLGAEFFRTDRGGLITFHGPGQLVVYPILNLQNFTPGVRWYVQNLEKTIIDLCASYRIKAYTSPHTGVWVNDSKICALGIHVKRYITTHGLALNCNVDLKWFSHIIPCGIEGKTVTSLSEQLESNIEIKEVLPKFLEIFSKRFNCEIIDFSDKDLLKNISF